MIKGYKTILVGSSPAPNAINSLVERLKPDMVLLSATTTTPFEKDPDLLANMDDFAAKHKNIRFYLGGGGSIQYMKGKHLNSITVAKSISDILKT